MLQAVIFIICVIPSKNSELNTSISLDKVNINLNSSSTTESSDNVTLKNTISFNLKASKLLENSSLPLVENKTEESIKLAHDEVITESSKKEKQEHILFKIHATITRSKDAVWATIVLTFMCVILVLAVAQSQMWKDYHGSDSQGVPLPNFNERVLFRDVMKHRMKSFKELFKKKSKNSEVELESLITANEDE